MTAELPYCPIAPDQVDVRYLRGPDSEVQDGVPTGTVTAIDGERKCWVYAPAQYDGSQPADLLVLHDGEGFLDPDDDMRTTVVLDNLIHRGALPVTIAVFVEPTPGRRNAEYDAFDDRHATQLAQGVLAPVADRWSVTDDPRRRTVGGFSSGGNAAFSVAWLRPDLFGRVLCLLPSFAQMPDGNPYPALIPNSTRKPLRVFLQTARHDLGWDEPEHNWLAQTLRVAAALAEAGYEHRLVVGEGGHDSQHAGVLLPDALRWLSAADGS